MIYTYNCPLEHVYTTFIFACFVLIIDKHIVLVYIYSMKANRLKTRMIKEAKKRYTIIYPVPGKVLEECFTNDLGFIIFWFNTKDNSTHVIREKV